MARTRAATASASAATPSTQAADRPRGRKRAGAAVGDLKRGQVLGRGGEILSRARQTGYENPFELPEHLREKGWAYQWVRTSCHGKADPANVSSHMQNGYRPVQDAAVRDFYQTPQGTASIERDGLILMERPQELTDEAIAEGYEDAVSLKHTQDAAFGMRDLPDGFAAGRKSKNGKFDASRKVKRTLEQSPADLRPQLDLSTGDDDD
jgi:hypothetical protein